MANVDSGDKGDGNSDGDDSSCADEDSLDDPNIDPAILHSGRKRPISTSASLSIQKKARSDMKQGQSFQSAVTAINGNSINTRSQAGETLSSDDAISLLLTITRDLADIKAKMADMQEQLDCNTLNSTASASSDSTVLSLPTSAASFLSSATRTSLGQRRDDAPLDVTDARNNRLIDFPQYRSAKAYRDANPDKEMSDDVAWTKDDLRESYAAKQSQKLGKTITLAANSTIPLKYIVRKRDGSVYDDDEVDDIVDAISETTMQLCKETDDWEDRRPIINGQRVGNKNMRYFQTNHSAKTDNLFIRLALQHEELQFCHDRYKPKEFFARRFKLRCEADNKLKVKEEQHEHASMMGAIKAAVLAVKSGGQVPLDSASTSAANVSERGRGGGGEDATPRAAAPKKSRAPPRKKAGKDEVTSDSEVEDVAESPHDGKRDVGSAKAKTPRTKKGKGSAAGPGEQSEASRPKPRKKGGACAAGVAGAAGQAGAAGASDTAVAAGETAAVIETGGHQTRTAPITPGADVAQGVATTSPSYRATGITPVMANTGMATRNTPSHSMSVQALMMPAPLRARGTSPTP
ncbi:hypothetical protein OC834_000335, partial [Tilletia horrida]